MNLTVAILGAFAALIAAGAAIGSLMAAQHANQAAQTLTAIEQHRWHSELTPQFEVSCRPRGGGSDRAILRVAFVGPVGLDRLDEMTVTICDDTRDCRATHAGGHAEEEIAQQIWGPYRLARDVGGADPTGRRVPPIGLVRCSDRSFELEATRPPSWGGLGDAGWQQEYQGSPVRLALRSWREGHEEWTVRHELFPTEDRDDAQQ